MPVDTAGLESFDEVIDAALTRLAAVLATADNRPLAVRVELTGECAARDFIESHLPQFTAELRARAVAESNGRLWIEKVRFPGAPCRPVIATDPAVAEDALSEIRAAISELRGDPQLMSEILKEGDCGELLKKLPLAYRWGLDVLEPTDPKNMMNWLDLAESYLAAAVRSWEAGQ
jgi:hypothetical protein